ncbi:MAG: winged helix-turn-helix transcriptional regulator [Mycobacteriaceae bacterium]
MSWDRSKASATDNAEDDARRCTQTARLRERQDEIIVERRVHSETPVRVEYVLTTKGQERQAVVKALSQWAEKWMVADQEPAH